MTKRLLKYLYPYKGRFLLAFLTLLLATGFELLIPLFVSKYIDSYLVKDIKVFEYLWFLILLIILLQFFVAIFRYLNRLLFKNIAYNIIRFLRIEVFRKILFNELSFFDKTSVGSLLSRITNDTEAVKDVYTDFLSSFLKDGIFVLGIFVAMFFLDVKLALYCLVLLPLILTLMHFYRLFSGRIYEVSRSLLSKINAKLNESLQGMNVIQAFCQEERLAREFYDVNNKHYETILKDLRYSGLLLRPAMHFLYILTLTFVLAFFGFSYFHKNVKIGVLYGFINLLERIFEPISNIMVRLSSFQQSFVAGKRVFQILDYNSYSFTKLRQPNLGIKIEKGKVEFHNVSFSYNDNLEVLKNISFRIDEGQTVAFVGHTGSGKSSILNLLLRLYPPNEGYIKIDGHFLNDYPEEEIRSKIGVVFQDSFIFADTIYNNVTMHKNIEFEKVQKAISLVQLAPFVKKLPKKYEQNINERGTILSTGQRQLLAFARAIVLDPKILLLDEATANIDTQTEKMIQRTLNKIRKGRTTLIVAHRLSTIKNADKIYFLHRGRIVEEGTHQELLNLKGKYLQFINLQKN